MTASPQPTGTQTILPPEAAQSAPPAPQQNEPLSPGYYVDLTPTQGQNLAMLFQSLDEMSWRYGRLLREQNANFPNDCIAVLATADFERSIAWQHNPARGRAQLTLTEDAKQELFDKEDDLVGGLVQKYQTKLAVPFEAGRLMLEAIPDGFVLTRDQADFLAKTALGTAAMKIIEQDESMVDVYGNILRLPQISIQDVADFIKEKTKRYGSDDLRAYTDPSVFCDIVRDKIGDGIVRSEGELDKKRSWLETREHLITAASGFGPAVLTGAGALLTHHPVQTIAAAGGAAAVTGVAGRFGRKAYEGWQNIITRVQQARADHATARNVLDTIVEQQENEAQQKGISRY